jgi:hypothetical protein
MRKLKTTSCNLVHKRAQYLSLVVLIADMQLLTMILILKSKVTCEEERVVRLLCDSHSTART